MMDLARYLRHVAAFNGQDWDLVHREFYAEDIRVRFPVATLTGRAESLAWFRTAHEALFEVLVPKGVRISPDGGETVADLAVRFVALDDTDFIPGPGTARAGDTADVAMRATYLSGVDGLITHLDVDFTGPPVPGRIG
ncbi:nuclear transport factor 2 family protein [Amycolatopsis sp. BJA-103]|uniref:nuclear transport factor 2 family protein n=1 Tax=Amycolatopsis sp. BJA-103 TaxID=1911175 RepID=UPI000C777B0E|nr:nuclear transport factor 2 family protein [Amycolatopsis sp. BJA-103]